METTVSGGGGAKLGVSGVGLSGGDGGGGGKLGFGVLGCEGVEIGNDEIGLLEVGGVFPMGFWY